MANPTQAGIEVINKEFKRDENDNVLCTDKVEVKVNDKRSRNLKSQNLKSTPVLRVVLVCVVLFWFYKFDEEYLAVSREA